MSGFANPIEYIFAPKELGEGKFHVKYKIPYADVEHLDEYINSSIATKAIKL